MTVSSVHGRQLRPPLSPGAEMADETGAYRCMHCGAPAHSGASACPGCGIPFTGAGRFQLVATGGMPGRRQVERPAATSPC